MKMRFWELLFRRAHWPLLEAPYFNDTTLLIDQTDLLQREILSRGEYEPELRLVLSELIRENEVLWDIGAHMGSFGMKFVKDARVSSVHFFEPTQHLFQQLQATLKRNRIEANGHRVALGEKCGEIDLYLGRSANRGLNSRYFKEGLSEKEACPMKTIDQLIQEGLPAPSFLKIDVEGGELPILQGAKEALNSKRLKGILFETAIGEQGEIGDFELKKLLIQHHFTLRHIPRISGLVEPNENFFAIR